MKLSISLTTLVGEFMSLQKSPDAKITTQSNCELHKAVKQEKLEYTGKLKKEQFRQRSVSTSQIDDPHVSGLQGVVLRSGKRKERPNSLIEMIKKTIGHQDKTAIAEEDEGSEHPAATVRGERRTHSECLH